MSQTKTMLDPGNAVLDAFANGEYLAAIQIYQQLETKTAADQYWAASAMVFQNQTLEAMNLFCNALAKGLNIAATGIALVYRSEGKLAQAHETLEHIKPELLDPFEKAVFYYEQGALALHHGKAKDCVQLLDRSLEIAQSDPIAKRFRASFALLACDALTRLGRDQQLIALSKFALQGASPAQAARLRLARAVCYGYTGQPQLAKDEYKLALENASPNAIPVIRFYEAAAHRHQGLNTEAAEALVNCIHLANAANQPEIESYAELELAHIARLAHDDALARASINRASRHLEGASLKAELLFTQGAILLESDPNGAIELLNQALESFEKLEAERDVGLCELHLAEAHLRINSDAARQHLKLAVDARHRLGSGARFASELRGLPLVFDTLIALPTGTNSLRHLPTERYLRILLEDWCQLETNQPALIQLKSIGAYNLTFNGTKVRLHAGMAVTVELLAYLAQHGQTDVNTLADNLFEELDSPHREIKQNRIHTVRSSLKRALPQLEIAYNQSSRTYNLKPHGVQFVWDVQTVRDAITIGGEAGLRRAMAWYDGPFLPNNDNQWVFEVRDDLQFRISQLGLSVLIDLQRNGHIQKCLDLAHRLLEINPFDISTAVLMVTVTRDHLGHMQAAQLLDVLEARFKNLIGEMPEPLAAMQGVQQRRSLDATQN